YLSASTYIRAFAGYVQEFNRNFLSLPALPARTLPDACTNTNIVVRAIPTEKHGTYFALINVSLKKQQQAVINLPAGGELIRCALNKSTGKKIPAGGGKIMLNFHPCELKALLVK
ncbi:MAG TPA: hypothetical protein VKS21_06310, partial [Spirochaetota bacterium]|nr:hypothetical protein [Spirochaetota bacterium]